MRRRLYVAAMAALCVYWLTEALAHGGGDAVSQGGPRVFTAEIVDSPIRSEHENGGAEDVSAAEPLPATPEERKTATAAEDLTPPAAPAPVAPVATTAPAIPSKAHAARVAPRAVGRRASKPETVARSPEPAEPVYEVPAWEPPPQRIAAVPHGPAGGCSGAKWSRPDAAGVPVLLCD